MNTFPDIDTSEQPAAPPAASPRAPSATVTLAKRIGFGLACSAAVGFFSNFFGIKEAMRHTAKVVLIVFGDPWGNGKPNPLDKLQQTLEKISDRQAGETTIGKPAFHPVRAAVAATEKKAEQAAHKAADAMIDTAKPIQKKAEDTIDALKERFGGPPRADAQADLPLIPLGPPPVDGSPQPTGTLASLPRPVQPTARLDMNGGMVDVPLNVNPTTFQGKWDNLTTRVGETMGNLNRAVFYGGQAPGQHPVNLPRYNAACPNCHRKFTLPESARKSRTCMSCYTSFMPSQARKAAGR